MPNPPFAPKPAQRRLVELMVGEISEDVIAQLVGVSPKTLRKHFHNELTYGRSKVLAECLKRLDGQSKKGNVSATKALVARKDVASPDINPKPPKLGKKEDAALAAQTAEIGTGWGDVLH